MLPRTGRRSNISDVFQSGIINDAFPVQLKRCHLLKVKIPFFILAYKQPWLYIHPYIYIHAYIHRRSTEGHI